MNAMKMINPECTEQQKPEDNLGVIPTVPSISTMTKTSNTPTLTTLH
jgi:hypothetical protein